MLALDHCIREMCSADHYTCDRTCCCTRYLKNVPQCGSNATSHILGGWSLDLTDHLKTIHQNSIRIGTTHINADSKGHIPTSITLIELQSFRGTTRLADNRLLKQVHARGCCVTPPLSCNQNTRARNGSGNLGRLPL